MAIGIITENRGRTKELVQQKNCHNAIRNEKSLGLLQGGASDCTVCIQGPVMER
jgi:hypothetical protein